MIQRIYCVHKWGPPFTGDKAMKYCPRCDHWWTANAEQGFIDEPKVALGTIE